MKKIIISFVNRYEIKIIRVISNYKTPLLGVSFVTFFFLLNNQLIVFKTIVLPKENKYLSVTSNVSNGNFKSIFGGRLSSIILD